MPALNSYLLPFYTGLRINFIFPILLLCLHALSASAQKEAQTWYFGQNAGLDFSTSPPTPLANGQINTREGVSSISDKSTGQLLFYSEGTTVWNRNHAVMPNGTGLQGDYSSTQSSVIVPNPGIPNQYYLFTTALSQGVRYSVIDMTLAGGLGDVIAATKNTALITPAASSEKLIAVQHCNKQDFWVVTHTINSNTFYVYLVNATGVQAPVTYHIGYSIAGAANWEATGYLKFSPDGSKLVHVIGPASSGALSRAEILSFNNSTGALSGPVTALTNLNSPYGAEFSQSNKYLYISELLGKRLLQYDLTAPNINASQYTITTSANLLFGALQLGPDNKIYVSAENGYNTGYGFLGVINNPETMGAGCGYVQDAINLNGKATLIGLPTFNATFLQKDTASVQLSGNCQSAGITFNLTNTNNTDSVKWSFGDASDSSMLLNPVHTYATPNVYTIRVVIYRSCNVNDTIKKTITIINCNQSTVIAAFTAPDTVCINNPVTINNTSVAATSYFWNFCTGNLNNPPVGANMGNIAGAMTSPVYIDYVEDNGNYYGFVTDNYTGKLFRLDFGNNLLNTPTLTNFGNLNGVLPVSVEGIQVIKNEGKWYAIIVGGEPAVGVTPFVIKVEFGANITNPNPVATNWGNLGNMQYPHDLYVFNDGPNWYGLTVNTNNNTITRFNFTSSFSNTPTAVNLGNIGNLAGPTGIHAIKENNNWHAFVTNANGNTFTRLDFGNSLLNTPTGQNLGNPGGIFNVPWDIYVIKFCGEILAYVINASGNSNSLLKLDFNGSITNTPVVTNFGNIGNLNFPHCLSKIFRTGADLYTFVPNVSNQTLSRIQFPGCTNASLPNSTDQNPTPIIYNTPGTYNINLTVDDGLPTQTAFCKQVVVLPAPVSAPTQRMALCQGVSQRIGTGTPAATYLWNTGATTDSIDVNAPGTYWVDIDRFGCKATDTFIIKSASCNNISNIINDYTEVLAFDPCNNTLQVGNATAYKVGDTVLLIQMKGAVIDATNTAAFGDVTDYKAAGNYEFNYIKSKTGNTIELLNIVTKQYDVPDGKVQLVRVPYYEDAVITAPLTCLPWDGGKGGILVLNARNTITLHANIDASEKGFRGGLATIKPSDCAENNYFYGQASNKAALKGEGIVLLDNTMARGKGKAVNGGGGGNNHNAGGGGGSNAGKGGDGGKEHAVAGCVQAVNGGIGGMPLPYANSQNKIFMGGGGGAGDVNGVTGAVAPGGNGGGIALIMANEIYTNGNAILSKGQTPLNCTGNDCWEGQSGGGAGGTILLAVDNIIGTTTINISGGNGANLSNSNPGGYNGPGGGGGGGMLWLKAASQPAAITYLATGGIKGIFTATGDPGGAQDGATGGMTFNLQVPVATVPFKRNIDSVRIKQSFAPCTLPTFEGLAWTNTHAISSWHWYFGDGQEANTQNTSHIYQATGNYTVKLVVTDMNSCKDSISTNIHFDNILDFDFAYQTNICTPLEVQFSSLGTATSNTWWDFGDNNTTTGSTQPSHTYANGGTYKVRYSVTDGACTDTLEKLITINVLPDDIIITPDTTICDGTTKQLRTKPSLSFCWFPTTYLDNPNSPNPVTSTPHDIIYYFNAEVTGNNLITNGDFSAGNTAFTSQYIYAANNTTEGQYYVGASPQAWNASLSPCTDHTTGNGNMMLVNGSPAADVNVWTQTITVTPNTNYAFSTWIQALFPPNPAILQFSINGKDIGNLITASLPTCTWSQFYTTWNSGNQTTATIAIVNKNTQIQGNDFALDDISFAPVLIKRDSVTVKVDTPVVRTILDTTVCKEKPVTLYTTGAATYTWSPATALSSPAIANPVASPAASTEYIVTGTTINGCVAKDTVAVNVFPKPIITKTQDTTVCRNVVFPLHIAGGASYAWSPANQLNNPASNTPLASPGATDITYYVEITDSHSCISHDSVQVSIRPYPIFTASGNQAICHGTSTTLRASGGDQYQWTPAHLLSDASSPEPVATPDVTTTFSVYIRETTCGFDTTINRRIIVNPVPELTVEKANDINCNTPTAQLNASGALQYAWSPATNLDNPNKANPVTKTDTTTQYAVTGTNQYGCSSTAFLKVMASKEGIPRFVVPNAFTPNGDRNNDCFGIQRWGNAKVEEFIVYNRWGQQVFKTTDPSRCWDGTFNGKPQDTGGYIYVIKAKTLCGEVVRKGMVMLIR